MAEDGGRSLAGEERKRTEAASPPARVGGFMLERRLSRSDGFSTVYAARSPRDDEPVALRVFAELADRPAAARALTQAMALRRRLNHPGLVPVLDAGWAREAVWVAMPLLPAETLADLLEREGRLTLERTLEILTPVAGALDAAHAIGLVCDALGPHAILLRTDGPGHADGVLTDVGPPWPGALRRGRMLGDVEGLAPEEIRGAPPSPRSNIYALGALLVRCVTGQPPFPATARAMALAAHIGSPPPRPSDRVPGLPAALDEVVARALAKDPEDRYASAGTLIAAAARAMEGGAESVDADAVGGPATAGDAGAAVGAGAPPAAEHPDVRRSSAPRRIARPRRAGPRRRLLGVVLAAVALVAAGAVAAIILGPGRSSPEPGAERTVTVPPRPRPVTSATLAPPGRPPGATGPSGAVRVDVRRRQRFLTIAGEGLPAERRHPPEAYAVWLYNSRLSAVRLGYVVPPVGRDGRFLNHEGLPSDATRYRLVVVTLERRASALPSGPIVLRGRLPVP